MTAKSEAAKTELNKLIDWYEKFKPDAGQSIKTNISRKELLHFCNVRGEDRLTYWYRNREIIPVDALNETD